MSLESRLDEKTDYTCLRALRWIEDCDNSSESGLIAS